jgi:hypothetical protein
VDDDEQIQRERQVDGDERRTATLLKHVRVPADEWVGTRQAAVPAGTVGREGHHHMSDYTPDTTVGFSVSDEDLVSAMEEAAQRGEVPSDLAEALRHSLTVAQQREAELAAAC